MKRLISWSIDHHWMVLALSVVLAAAGLWTAQDMPVDVFPDLTAPTVTILVEGRGMARVWKSPGRPPANPIRSGILAPQARRAEWSEVWGTMARR